MAAVLLPVVFTPRQTIVIRSLPFGRISGSAPRFMTFSAVVDGHWRRTLQNVVTLHQHAVQRDSSQNADQLFETRSSS